MDRFIAAMPADEDGDLMLCREHGVAYQKDMTQLVDYDCEYFEKCASYEDQDIALKINAGRVALVAKYYSGAVLDIGIGSGEFIKTRSNTYGCDVNPVAIEWLKRNDVWAHDPSAFGACTMWDVLEHLPEPEVYLKQIQLHRFLFVCMPLFYALSAIRMSKHYRPGEHLYYWTEAGFAAWMERHGFMMLERQTFEIDAGRESIYSFAFKRYRWPNGR